MINIYAFILVVLVNLLLFIIHKLIYKTHRDFRKNWIRATIAFGAGFGFHDIIFRIYSVSKDYSTLLISVIIVACGFVMIIVNRCGKMNDCGLQINK